MLGLYSFARPLQVGDRLIIEDMSHYTMVKTTTFNGVRLPAIVLYEPETDGACKSCANSATRTTGGLS